jgi:hypothetical protein
MTRLAAESEARYGRRFRMQDLDKALATVQSGLLQVPTLLVRRATPTSGPATSSGQWPRRAEPTGRTAPGR